jgi:hypothetical protein
LEEEDDIIEQMRLRAHQEQMKPVPAPVSFGSAAEETSRRARQSFTLPTPEQLGAVEQVMPRLEDNKTYTPTTLLEDPNAMGVIRNYMQSLHGVGSEVEDNQLVEMYLAKMRKFSAGQSVVVGNEFFQLQRGDDKKKAIAGQAYDLFDRLDGMWSENYTPGETFGAFGTYMRAVVVDPTNLIGLGVGRAAFGGGSKAAAVTLRMAAKEAAKQATETAIKSGVTKELAAQAGEAAAKQVMVKSAESAALRSAVKSSAIKQVALATTVDTALALGVDAAYQSSLIKSGQQEDWSPFSSGLTLLGAIGAGGLDAGLRLTEKAITRAAGELGGVAKVGRIGLDKKHLVTQAQIDAADFKAFDLEIEDTFAEKVKRGSDLSVLESPERVKNEPEVWKEFFLGVDNQHSGLVHALYASGFRAAPPRYEGDVISNQIGDFLNNMPESSKDKVMKAFRVIVGDKFYKGVEEVEDLTDLISYRVHEGAVEMNIRSQMARALGVKMSTDNVPISQEFAALLSPKPPRELRSGGPERLAYLQSSLIQTIVSHPATTALNIAGTSYRTAADTLSDVVRGSLYTASGARGFLTGNLRDFNKGIRILKAAAQRPATLFRPTATAEEAADYFAERPKVKEQLTQYISGGIESNERIMEMYNIDPSTPWVWGLEKYKKLAQDVSFAQKQDQFFKTQLFMQNLNRRLLEDTGMNYSEFMSRPVDRVAVDMASEQYARIELGAVDDALKGTFSKSYSKAGSIPLNTEVGKGLQHVATFLEGIRKIPIIGALAPFGQFFNNTIDLMSDYSGMKFLWRLNYGAGRDDQMDSLAKGAVGWVAAWMISNKELEAIDQGLAWNEERTADGDIQNKLYDFPESFFKMAGRMLAHARKDDQIPQELWAEASKTFGIEAFTRNFDQTLTNLGSSIGDSVSRVRSNPVTINSIMLEFAQVVGENVGAAWVSGFTRPLDPINQLVGATSEDGFTTYDRKTGVKALNNSLRYLDQIAGPILEERGTQVRNPVFPSDSIQTMGKLTGYRNIPAQGNAQKMFNAIERPQYLDNLRNPNVPEAVNAVRKEFMVVLEEKATDLVESKYWKQMNQQAKRENITRVLTESKKEAIRRLRESYVVEDQHMSVLFDLYESASDANIQQAFEELGFSGKYADVTDLDAHQLRLLVQSAKSIERKNKLAPYVGGYQ